MERENYVDHLKDPQNYQNTNRPAKRQNWNNGYNQTGLEQSIVAEPVPGLKSTYFNPGPGRNSAYAASRSDQDTQDYGEFGLRTPQRNDSHKELQGDFGKEQKSDGTRKTSSHPRDNEKDRTIPAFATGPRKDCVIAEPIPGQRNVYFNPGPGLNSGFRIPKLGQKCRKSDTETTQNEADFSKATEEQMASRNELNPRPVLSSGFRIPKLGQKSRDTDTITRQNADDSATATDHQIASDNEMEQNDIESRTRPKSKNGEVRTGSGRFSSGPRLGSAKHSRDSRTRYDSREFITGKNGPESNSAGFEENSGGLRRGKGQNRKARSPINTNYNWRERD